MDNIIQLLDSNNPILYIIIAWSVIWKGIALWHCGRNKQLAWYLTIFIVNTCGVLEIVYLILSKRAKSNY